MASSGYCLRCLLVYYFDLVGAEEAVVVRVMKYVVVNAGFSSQQDR